MNIKIIPWFQNLTETCSVAQSCLTLCNPTDCTMPGFPVLYRCLWLFATPWTAERQASLYFTISWSLLKLFFIESMMPSIHLILCQPPHLLPSIFPRDRVFSNELALHFRWSNYWSFSISPSSEYSGLISFRTDWFDLLAIQGTLKSLVQHHILRASILWCLAFFMDQLSHPYMTTGKTIALTTQTFVSKVMSLLFNMLSRFVIAFLPRRKHLLISWLQSPTTVILEPKKIKSFTVSIVSPSICHEVMGPDAMIFIFLLYLNRDVKVLPNLTLLQTYLLVLSILMFEQSPGPPWTSTFLLWLQLQSLQAGPPSQGAAMHNWAECR